MPVHLVIGGQWGDEGKAKIVDSLAADADYVVRFQGGANAGHTVLVGDRRFAFHLVPSGILHTGVVCVLGGGMVVDPIELSEEIRFIEANGIDVRGRILVSEQAHVVLPYHVAMDVGEEEARGENRIGSTGRGITPAYVDKVGRTGLRMCDLLLAPAKFERLVRRRIEERSEELAAAGYGTLSPEPVLDGLLKARKRLRPLITDTRIVLWRAIDEGKRILCEGAQGTLLDLDHGTYPFVTSSSSSAGGAALGAGFPPTAIEKVIGVFKAYCTRVGNGPFPTEERGPLGCQLRELGAEYGTTTGRPRRCGWFDAVAARTAVRLNGITEMALTKLDVLNSFSKIKVCTQYRLGKRTYQYMPVDTELLSRCRPVYAELEGWGEKITAGRYDDLPSSAKRYIGTLEELCGARISLISIGPERRALMRAQEVRRDGIAT